MEPTKTAESFSFACWIFSFRRFPSIASSAFFTPDFFFDIFTSLIGQSLDDSFDDTQLSQHREVSGSVAEQSGEQRPDEVASDVSGALSIAPSAKESIKTGGCPVPFSLRDGPPPNEF
jgi:hypothetical protein